MDTQHRIDEEKRALQELKSKLEREIDTLHKEIDHVEQDTLGVMNKIKMLAAMQLRRSDDFEAVMGEAYARSKRGEFRNAQEYIEHLKKSIDEARGAISKINEVLANLDAIARDQSTLDSRLSTWLQKADQLKG